MTIQRRLVELVQADDVLNAIFSRERGATPDTYIGLFESTVTTKGRYGDIVDRVTFETVGQATTYWSALVQQELLLSIQHLSLDYQEAQATRTILVE